MAAPTGSARDRFGRSLRLQLEGGSNADDDNVGGVVSGKQIRLVGWFVALFTGDAGGTPWQEIALSSQSRGRIVLTVEKCKATWLVDEIEGGSFSHI